MNPSHSCPLLVSFPLCSSDNSSVPVGERASDLPELASHAREASQHRRAQPLRVPLALQRLRTRRERCRRRSDAEQVRTHRRAETDAAGDRHTDHGATSATTGERGDTRLERAHRCTSSCECHCYAAAAVAAAAGARELAAHGRSALAGVALQPRTSGDQHAHQRRRGQLLAVTQHATDTHRSQTATQTRRRTTSSWRPLRGPAESANPKTHGSRSTPPFEQTFSEAFQLPTSVSCAPHIVIAGIKLEI